MKLVYTGPAGRKFFTRLNREIKHGEPFEVDDIVGQSLLAQYGPANQMQQVQDKPAPRRRRRTLTEEGE